MGNEFGDHAARIAEDIRVDVGEPIVQRFASDCRSRRIGRQPDHL
jgi:hypothetical protein